MKKLLIAISLVALMGVYSPVSAAKPDKYALARAEVLKRGKGYYKDVFMDGGIALTSKRSLPATEYLGLSLEFFASAKRKEQSKVDTLIQHKILTGSEEDTNGWLLYPDGAPRYRMIFFNGGLAASHLKSMEPSSRANICNYVAAGGSTMGTCAGAFMTSKGSYTHGLGVRHGDTYLGLWPDVVYRTELFRARTAMKLGQECPLNRYFDFGTEQVVKDVFHNNGCYAEPDNFKNLPQGVEALSYYVYPYGETVNIDGKASAWAYKAGENSGRLISCGSHPESVKEGARRDYMTAMMLYAMDGNAAPQPKGELKAGEVREMNKRTEDKAPAYTRIGDKQYHHFVVNVPKRTKNLVVTLEGYEGENNFDLMLCSKREALAYDDNTDYKSEVVGCNKQLAIKRPKAGKWYVSVHCATTVTTTVGKYGTEYSGRTDVLNGVPYKVSVKFE